MRQNTRVLRLEPQPTRSPLWDLSAIRVRIDGMGCTGCAVRVREGLLSLPGVTGAQVDHQSGTASIVFDPSQLGVHQVIESIERIGTASGHEYAAAPVSAVSVNVTNGGRW